MALGLSITVAGVTKTATELRTALRDVLFDAWEDVVKNFATTGGRISKTNHLLAWKILITNLVWSMVLLMGYLQEALVSLSMVSLALDRRCPMAST